MRWQVIVTQIVEYGRQLERSALDPQFEPPILDRAGRRDRRAAQAVNIIPDRCVAEIELRAVPGVAQPRCSSR